MFKRNFIFLLYLFLSIQSCATTGQNASGEKSPQMLAYSKNAAQLYEKGMSKLNSHNCGEAVKIFTKLKEKYPFSRYARVAELRIADCSFDTEDYAQASQKYKEFTQRYPSHDEVDYAAFKRALSTFKRIPSKLFILPPVYERDQSFIREATREFRQFLNDYPDSNYYEEARKYYVKCMNMLAEHELYVAMYYYKKKKYNGAIKRLEGVVEKLKDSDLVPEAILLMAICYLKMKKVDQAKATFNFIVEKYPDSYQSKQAAIYLRGIKNKD